MQWPQNSFPLRYFSQLYIMFVGGPNTRKDYHIEEGEEVGALIHSAFIYSWYHRFSCPFISTSSTQSLCSTPTIKDKLHHDFAMIGKFIRFQQIRVFPTICSSSGGMVSCYVPHWNIYSLFKLAQALVLFTSLKLFVSLFMLLLLTFQTDTIVTAVGRKWWYALIL